MRAKFSEFGYYGLLGLSKPHWDQRLGGFISLKLTENEKLCVFRNELENGSKTELIAEAAEFFRGKRVFYRDEEGEVQSAYFYDYFDLPNPGPRRPV